MKQIALGLFVVILAGACAEPLPSARQGTVSAAEPVSEYTRHARARRAERAYVGEPREAREARARRAEDRPRVGSAEWHRRQEAAAPPPPPPNKGAWRTAAQEDPVTGSTRHVAVLNASNETKGHVFQTTPTLYVRCQDNRTEAYINWGNYLDGNSGDFRDNRHVVTLRIGDGDPFTVRANVSTNNESTFFPSPIPSILKPAASADTLAARTTPYNESPQTAIFNVTGMRAALADLAAACNWSFD